MGVRAILNSVRDMSPVHDVFIAINESFTSFKNCLLETEVRSFIICKFINEKAVKVGKVKISLTR